MKYPKLAPVLDKRRKLMPEDITAIHSEWNFLRAKGESMNAVAVSLSVKYRVSDGTILYWCYPKYREQMMAKNAKAHSKANIVDYEHHRAKENKLKVDRMHRSPELMLWHEVTSAKNEKRCSRKSVHGISLEKLI